MLSRAVRSTVVLSISSAMMAGCAGSRSGGSDIDGTVTIEEAVVHEVNLARTNPRLYAKFTRQWRQYYDGNLRKAPGHNPVRTIEGVAALDEAILYLESVDPVQPLIWSEGMSEGARDHVDNTGPAGDIGHSGSNGSAVGERVNRYGRWQHRVGENISYGGNDAREFVMRLIIDDGIADRGHRTNIFAPDFRYVGVAFGYHATYKTMCVMTLATEYVEAGNLIPQAYPDH
ncbi:MAG: CAP domain-containing protein [bacterium]|nr:CAP domain-containing protein [bacterium]